MTIKYTWYMYIFQAFACLCFLLCHEPNFWSYFVYRQHKHTHSKHSHVGHGAICLCFLYSMPFVVTRRNDTPNFQCFRIYPCLIMAVTSHLPFSFFFWVRQQCLCVSMSLHAVWTHSLLSYFLLSPLTGCVSSSPSGLQTFELGYFYWFAYC